MGRSGGGGASFGTSGFEQLLRRVGRLPGTTRYAMRNMFRQKTRLALTLITLTLAGAIFITVVSIQTSLEATMAEIADYWQEDVSIRFPRTYRSAKVTNILAEMPGVAALEGRLWLLGFRVNTDGTEANQTTEIFGVKLPSKNLKPTVTEGRWLQPGDENKVVIDINFAAEEPDVAVGDDLILKIDGEDTTWQVVGVVNGQVVGTSRMAAPVAYVNYNYLAELSGETGRINRMLVTTPNHSGSFQAETQQLLEDQLQRVGLPVAFSITYAEIQRALQNVFAILTSLLLLMTVLFASVGGMGLANMMSLNVLERTTEIGIVRVIGGEHKDIRQIVIIEGICVGLLSWFLGLILAIPMSKFLGDAVGIVFIRQPLTYTYSFSGLVMWLGIVIVLSIIASLAPAHNASQISVRETLAYE